MTAVAERDEIAEAYAAAAERKQARRNVYRTYSDADALRARLEGRTLERISIYAPEFRDPASAAEWWDDRILETGGRNKRGFPDLQFLAALAAAARDGGDSAAVRTVRAARELSRPAQWTAYQNLMTWKAALDATRFGADRVIGRALGEWSRLRLAQTESEEDE